MARSDPKPACLETVACRCAKCGDAAAEGRTVSIGGDYWPACGPCASGRPQTLADLRAQAEATFPADRSYPTRTDYFHGNYTRDALIRAAMQIGMTPAIVAEQDAKRRAEFGPLAKDVRA